MKHVLAIALTLAAGAAQAQMPYPLPPAALPNKAALPPLEFDKPFTGKLKVIRGDKFLMDRLCPKTAFTPALGCSYSANDFSECVVIMAEDGIIYDAGWSPQIVWAS